jgi:hypothetical protein
MGGWEEAIMVVRKWKNERWACLLEVDLKNEAPNRRIRESIK